MPHQDLFEAAKSAMNNSHSPYSSFPVGAAIRATSGKIYAGCNIENASYPEGWCAETSAISHMIVGGDKEISEILVLSQKMEKITPCGGCRQRISEFAKANTSVHLCDADGVVETVTIGNLLPAGFELDGTK